MYLHPDTQQFQRHKNNSSTIFIGRTPTELKAIGPYLPHRVLMLSSERSIVAYLTRYCYTLGLYRMTTENHHSGHKSSGVGFAVSAYALWGLFPIYWKLLHHVPATQLFSHRIFWSFLWLAIVLAATGQLGTFRKAIINKRAAVIYYGAALLIGINWLLYVWAVNAGFIIETSLGYFINPLLSVLIGVIVLRERLRFTQWIPVGMAAAGVLFLTYVHGSPPWIALVLASTWATYGLLKKLAPLSSLHGLGLETGILSIPVIVYLVYCEISGQGAFLHHGFSTDLLLAGAGIVTTVPLFLFAVAVRRIPLSLVGILQYIAPTMQFLIGLLIYREPFAVTQLVGFSIVWLALILFAVESIFARQTSERQSENIRQADIH
jgi:chloramphenicol-sensitive protein RarD